MILFTLLVNVIPLLEKCTFYKIPDFTTAICIFCQQISQRALFPLSFGSTCGLAVENVKLTEPTELESTDARNDRAKWTHWMHHRQRRDENRRNSTDIRRHDSHIQLRWPREWRDWSYNHHIRQSRCSGTGTVSHQHEVSPHFCTVFFCKLLYVVGIQ